MAAATEPEVATESEVDIGPLVETFLRSCVLIMGSEKTRDMLKDPSCERPSETLAMIQTGCWVELGVNAASGDRAVNSIPSDMVELVALRKNVGQAILDAYLQCLEDRRPKVLEKTQKMTAGTVVQFLDARNVFIALPKVQEKMQQQVKETGSMPDLVVNETHDEVMELIGFDKDHGQASLKEFMESTSDPNILKLFAQVRDKTFNACISLLAEFKKQGGTINADEHVKARMMEWQARRDIHTMSSDERGKFLSSMVKKVSVFQCLPPAAKERYLEGLGEEERVELAKGEILVEAVAKAQAAEQEAKNVD